MKSLLNLFKKKDKLKSFFIDRYQNDAEYYHNKYLSKTIAVMLNELGYINAKGYEEKIEHRNGDYYSSMEYRYVDDGRPLATYNDAVYWLLFQKNIFIEVKLPFYTTDGFYYEVMNTKPGKRRILFSRTNENDNDIMVFETIEEAYIDAILSCYKYLTGKLIK